MNNVQLIGRITRDIELKQTQGGKAYCNFSLAVPREFSKEETDFINCVAWEKKAETIEKYVKKGHKFGVIGRIQIDQKDDKYYTKVIVEKIYFLENATNKNDDFDKNIENSGIDDPLLDDFPF